MPKAIYPILPSVNMPKGKKEEEIQIGIQQSNRNIHSNVKEGSYLFIGKARHLRHPKDRILRIRKRCCA